MELGAIAMEALVTNGRPSVPGCRSCGSASLESVLNLGKVPLANALLTAAQLSEREDRFELDLHFCPNCSLVQIGETVPPERLFRDYTYASSNSDTMLAHVRALVERVASDRRLDESSLVVEVASNDGYLLQYYKARNVPVLGVEPAANIAQLAINRGIPTLVAFFDEEFASRLAAEGKSADVLHAHNVFAHVPDPNRFVAGLRRLLKPGGVAIIEAPYVRDLIEHLEFDTIYHEHFSYYSLRSVEALCARCNMMVCDVEWVPIHGGSLRYYVGHAGSAKSERVAALLADEEARGLSTFAYYRDFSSRVWRLKNDLLALLCGLKAEGKRMAAYGASAKGSTLMNAFGIGKNLIDFVVDRSPLKQGQFTPGNYLPILPPGALIEQRPDYVLLLTWNFAQEILSQQTAYRDAGGKFIVPVPEVKIV